MCDAITPQFVCNDLSGYTAGFKETLEETFRRVGVSSLLQIYVDDLAILINRSPKVVLLATDLHEHFVQKIAIAVARVSAAKTFGKLRPKFVDLEPNSFV